MMYDGKHEAIVSEDVWTQAFAKRQQNGGRRDKVYSLDHEHLLSGILKCPVCGASMYGTVNRKKKKDGTRYKDSFFYVCKHRKLVDGRECSYGRQPPQDRINAEVESLVSDALASPVFLETMQERLNQTIDENEIKSRIETLEDKKAQLTKAKSKLAQRIDDLDTNDKHYDAKYADMETRLNRFYDEISEVDENIKAEQIKLTKVYEGRDSMENALKLLQIVQDNFSSLPDATQKGIFQEIIESVEIFEEMKPDGRQVKAVHFKFPVTVDGETNKDWWYIESHDETAVLLSRVQE